MSAAKILWKEEIHGELKLFYASVKALCFIVNFHWKHVSEVVNGNDAYLIHVTLGHLESAIAFEALDSPFHEAFTSAPRYEKLRIFNEHWERLQKLGDYDMTLRYARSCMKFGTNEEERNQFIRLLDWCEERLRLRYPENHSDLAHEELSTNAVGSASIAVWSAAQSIFKAFVACSNCECIPAHDIGVRLRLGTYLQHTLCKEEDTDDCLNFDIFLSMKQGWKEARVFMVKEIPESAVQIQTNNPTEQPGREKKATKIRQMRLKQLYAVLYLHDTPWIQPTWSSSHVLFLPTTSSSVPLQPFIQTPLASHYNSSQISCIDPDELDPDDPVHHCPLLVTLAVMLMELYFAVPFDILAKQYGLDIAGDNQSPISTLSSISRDNLDEFAKTIDIANWDQSIQQQARNEVIHHDLLRANFLANTPTIVNMSVHVVLLDLYAMPLEQRRQMTNAELLDFLMTKPFLRHIPRNHILQRSNYHLWKFRYLDVYGKFIPQSSILPNIKIAILDTGVDVQHPYIDARFENIQGRYNWLSEDGPANVRVVTDMSGHGTFAASLILDYAPDAQLFVAKIAEKELLKSNVIAKAINYAVSTWEVDVISMSFGFPTCNMDDYHELEDALANAHAKRVLLFAAASNSGGKLGRAYPARDQNVIAIHATDTYGNRSPFSPTALSHDINLATVGEAIESAWPVYLLDNSSSKALRCKSGTSFATAIAAGIAAFLLLYAKIHLPDKADALKSRRRMQALLKRVAEKEAGQTARDGYHFIDLSLYADSLFGKSKEFIDETIRDVLNT
ncbi:uncharacterized protein Triagg1_9479 [Trichoderma aggressivum f. europaeum]|uniref:Peptidase S8/S53 domain-containing protein n=1 Tax=Trichoderma aggressivum f. europaeum TaxID=173218 RepID=A0AAE1J1W2_9HYPO|nr:hypothetical protein Triagg1_9479 [Trichoderma aggressivum f. europaeum]